MQKYKVQTIINVYEPLHMLSIIDISNVTRQTYLVKIEIFYNQFINILFENIEYTIII